MTWWWGDAIVAHSDELGLVVQTVVHPLVFGTDGEVFHRFADDVARAYLAPDAVLSST